MPAQASGLGLSSFNSGAGQRPASSEAPTCSRLRRPNPKPLQDVALWEARNGLYRALHTTMRSTVALQTRIAVLATLLLCQALSWSQIIVVGVPLRSCDIAIEGPGWFVLRDPVTGEIFVTRIGNFFFDLNGYLSCGNRRVQGYNDETLSTLGDIKVDVTGAPGGSVAPLMSWSIDESGKLNLTLTDNTSFVRGQILLQRFRFPELLSREAHNLYALTPAAGPLQQPAAPGSPGLGKLLTGWLDSTPEPVRLTLLPSANRAGPLSVGVLTPTAVPTDLGIKGPGFFLVRDTNSSTLFATRAGLFLRDGEGYLITYDGLRVQGYSDYALSILGDVRIDSPPDPDAVFVSFSFDVEGKIIATRSDNYSLVCSQILLSDFARPQLLTVTNYGRYAGVAQAQPRQVSSGRLWQSTLELINVPEDLLALRRNLSFFSQGAINYDPINTHLAISGVGFFVLRNPLDGTQYVTRAGAFQFDANGYLINPEGLRVQGYSTPDLTTIGDIRVDSAGSTAVVTSFCFDARGQLTLFLDDGTSFIRGQVLLQTFREPFALKCSGPTLYTNLAAALPLPQLASPSTCNLGRICAGALELPPPAEQLTSPSRDGVRLKITGEPGRIWIIQAANNPGQWSTLNQITNVPDELEFTDTNSDSLSQRFYRVMVSQP